MARARPMPCRRRQQTHLRLPPPPSTDQQLEPRPRLQDRLLIPPRRRKQNGSHATALRPPAQHFAPVIHVFHHHLHLTRHASPITARAGRRHPQRTSRPRPDPQQRRPLPNNGKHDQRGGGVTVPRFGLPCGVERIQLRQQPGPLPLSRERRILRRIGSSELCRQGGRTLLPPLKERTNSPPLPNPHRHPPPNADP